jgi:hypothetical protein
MLSRTHSTHIHTHTHSGPVYHQEPRRPHVRGGALSVCLAHSLTPSSTHMIGTHICHIVVHKYTYTHYHTHTHTRIHSGPFAYTEDGREHRRRDGPRGGVPCLCVSHTRCLCTACYLHTYWHTLLRRLLPRRSRTHIPRWPPTSARCSSFSHTRITHIMWLTHIVVHTYTYTHTHIITHTRTHTHTHKQYTLRPRLL